MRRPAAVAALFVLLVFLPGCEGKSGHQVLTFFFDGVPPLADDAKATAVPGKEAPGVAAPRPAFKQHPPYEAKQCDSCHEKGTNKLPVIAELCGRCHSIDTNKKTVHPPFAAGECTTCHHPHFSRYRFLLVDKLVDLCFTCHVKDNILKLDVHKDMTEECTTCHSPHASDNERLLK